MRMTEEKRSLVNACYKLSEALFFDDDTEIAAALALMHIRMSEFIDSDYISYEAVDCELMKYEKGEK